MLWGKLRLGWCKSCVMHFPLEGHDDRTLLRTYIQLLLTGKYKTKTYLFSNEMIVAE
jgi:hypothetical protein